MMCPDHGAIDHVGGGIASRQLGQRLEHGVEHAGRPEAARAGRVERPLHLGVAAADAPAMGVNNSTDFIKATGEGELEAVATPIQLGTRTHVWSVEMRQGDTLIARTTLRTMILAERS